MDHISQATEKLEDFVCPAFTVTDGKILECNHAAAYIGLAPQQVVASLLDRPEDYGDFNGDCLYLPMTVGNTDFSAAIYKREGFDLFLLDYELEQQLLTFSLVSQKMRAPLADLMLCAEQLLQKLPESDSAVSANMRRSMNQLHRMACNMSDAARYSSETTLHQSTIDIAALINEVMERVCTIAEQNGIVVCYDKLNKPVDGLADAEKLERAVLNLMSNAMKVTPAGKTIRVSLRHSGNRLLFQVQDGGNGMQEDIRPTAFSQYQRKPSLFEYNRGLGLGMVIVRSAAAAHGGTLLLEHPKDEGLRITLSLAVRRNATPHLGSPLPVIDYAGGKDHALLELSDVLPADAYQTE